FALFGLLHVSQRTRDALICVVHGLVDRRAVLRAQPIFLVPDVERGLLEWNAVDVHGLKFDRSFHAGVTLPERGVIPKHHLFSWSSPPFGEAPNSPYLTNPRSRSREGSGLDAASPSACSSCDRDTQHIVSGKGIYALCVRGVKKRHTRT